MDSNVEITVEKVELKRFRAYESVEFHLGRRNVIVGRNGSGKTSVSLALDLLFNSWNSITDEVIKRHKYEARKTSEIAATLAGLRIRQNKHGEIKVEKAYEGKIELRIKLNQRKEIFALDVESSMQLRGSEARHVFSQISNYFIFEYVGTRRDDSLFSDVNYQLMLRVIERIRAERLRDRFKNKFAESAEGFLSYLKPLESEMSKSKVLRRNEQLSFMISGDYSPNLLAQYIGIMVEFEGIAVPFSELGSGARAALIAAMMIFLAKEQGKSLCLSFDEPEQNLHPQAQRAFVEYLTNSCSQFIASTHSPVVAKSVSVAEVIKCDYAPRGEKGAQVCQLPEGGIEDSLSSDFRRFFNAEGLFATCVILVEGETDKDLVEMILASLDSNYLSTGISVFPVGGCNNLVKVLNVLRVFGIKYFVLADMDKFYDLDFPPGDKYKTTKSPVIRNSDGSKSGRSPEYKSDLDEFFPGPFSTGESLGELLLALPKSRHRAYSILREKPLFVFMYNFECDILESPLGINASMRYLSSVAPDLYNTLVMQYEENEYGDALRHISRRRKGVNHLKKEGAGAEIARAMLQRPQAKTSIHSLKVALNGLLRSLDV